MNIGFFSQALPYLPSRGGFRLYGANLIRCLAKRHRIDLIALMQDGDEHHLDWPKQFCGSVQTIRATGNSMPKRLASFASNTVWGKPLNHRADVGTILREGLRNQQWDVLHIEGEFAGGLVDEELPVAKVLSLHDAEALRVQEMLNCKLSFRDRLYYTMNKYLEPRYNRQVYPRFERCIVVADRDLDFVQKLVPDANFAMIPYGTDTEYFHPVSVKKQKNALVFHSHLGYPPNIGAALEFANEIFPIIQREVPDAVFHLIGANPAPEIQALASRPGIMISANLPDLREAVCSGTVYVCAIRFGTGLKSKVLEAMAMQMPIVGYHPGSTVGIDCTYGVHLLAATTPHEFAAHVLDLLKNPRKAEDMAKTARRLVCEKYSWDSRAHIFEELYLQVKQERIGQPGRS
jgi:glycosyltransferase involved in cell wall biosynthesis